MRYCLMLIIVLLSSCGDESFTKFSELGGLRIMGITADVPEIDGTSSSNFSVTLTPYISDVDAGGRTFNVTVQTCMDPRIGNGSGVVCDNPNIETYPNGNTFNTRSLSGSQYTGAMDPITITITDPATKISSYSTQQKYNGVDYVVIFNLEVGGMELTAVKVIPITNRETQNNNPVIQDVTLDGGVISNSPNSNGTLNVIYTGGGGPEIYNSMNSDGSINSNTESYLITWFYIKGKVSPTRVLHPNTSQYTHESSNTFVAVVKDLRGGTAVRVLSP